MVTHPPLSYNAQEHRMPLIALWQMLALRTLYQACNQDLVSLKPARDRPAQLQRAITAFEGGRHVLICGAAGHGGGASGGGTADLGECLLVDLQCVRQLGGRWRSLLDRVQSRYTTRFSPVETGKPLHHYPLPRSSCSHCGGW